MHEATVPCVRSDQQPKAPRAPKAGGVISYDPPGTTTPADGTVTTAKLGGDVTDLAKDLLKQETTTNAQTTLDVAPAGTVVPFTF